MRGYGESSTVGIGIATMDGIVAGLARVVTLTKHTPGPWRVVQRGPIVSIIDAQEDAPNGGDHPIGDILTLYRGLPRTKETVLANARFIAAAPDVFEALAMIIKDDNAMDALWQHFDSMEMDKISAAIAKARGGSDKWRPTSK